MFVGLALEDLFFDGSRCDEAVNETVFLLPVTPDTREGLLICSRVPVRVKEDETVSTDEVETAASRFATEEEDELVAFGIIEFVNEFLPFADVHCAV